MVHLVFFLFACPRTFAHKASDSYLNLNLAGLQWQGEWHLALRDLNDVLDLDLDHDGAITWAELRSQKTAIFTYALSRLEINEAQPRPLWMTDLLVDRHSDGAYAVLRFVADHLASGGILEIRYRALFDVDRLHRGLLRLDTGMGTRTAVFSPKTTCQRFDLAAPEKRLAGWLFVREGIWHIWTGYDHMLFLIVLLLPGALRLTPCGWMPESSGRVVTQDLFRIVTAFTIAHSVTLALATLGCVRPPSRVVESMIAVSVLLAAANNVWPVIHRRAWLVACTFGLVHGFGFANALADLGLPRKHLAQALLGFNLGVELGQLVMASVFLPVVFACRRRLFYRQWLLPSGSCLVGITSAVWLTERLLDVKWLPF